MSAVSWKIGCDTAPFIYANNEPKSALAREPGDCRDNKGKLAKRVFTCLIGLNVVYMENDRIKKV